MAGTVGGVVRTAFRARWLPRHVLALVLIATLILLGRWQWDVSSSERGSLQNTLYAFQWWAMALMVCYGWWRLLRDDTYGRPEPVTVRLSSEEQQWTDGASWEVFEAGDPRFEPLAADPESERELADYNEYLSKLNARSERAL
jgi:DNA-binding transcriptional regulator of glucitol operon